MAKATGISEAKIRQAIWMLKAKKTKKQVCEHLGIAYNTKRLDNIIQEFHNNIEREAELKKKARLKKFTLEEKKILLILILMEIRNQVLQNSFMYHLKELKIF